MLKKLQYSLMMASLSYMFLKKAIAEYNQGEMVVLALQPKYISSHIDLCLMLGDQED